MKAFEEWNNKCKRLSRAPYWHRKESWEEALKWVLKQKYMDPESPTINNPDGYDIINAINIEEELEGI